MFSLTYLCFLCVISAQRFSSSYELNILHYNDFHARFEETSPSGRNCDPKVAPCIGGFARLATVVRDALAREPESLLLNAGDSFQGTIWYNLLRWNVTQDFMNMLPHDAHVLGNHEFDNGLEGLVPYLEYLKAPVVTANIVDDKEPTIQGLYEPSIIVEKGGRKIGIIGVILADTKILASTGKLEFTDEVETVRAEAAKLHEKGIDIIVVLSHCGIDIDRKIALEGGPHIDIIVGGHSHTLLYNDDPPEDSAFTPRGPYPVVVEQLSRKVLVSLSFYATGSYQRLVGTTYGTVMSQQSVSRALREVTDALNNPVVSNKWIKFPQTSQERNAIKRRFYEKFKFPGVLGCIDGTHVAIIRPKEHEERFFNRKHFHSRNVLIVLIVQAAAHTQFLGEIKLHFDSSGNLLNWEGHPHYVGNKIKQAPDVLEKINYYLPLIRERANVKVGTSMVHMSSRCACNECNLGNFICDGYLHSVIGRAEENNWNNAHFCVINRGDIRADISQGDITVESVLVTLPFDNKVEVFELRGDYILEMLEYSVAKNRFPGAVMLQVSGLYPSFDGSYPEFERVLSVSVRCIECEVPRYEPLQLDKYYRVVSQSFIGSGGDGYTMISNNRVNVSVVGVDNDILMDYIQTQSPVFSEVDGRIQIQNACSD